MENINIIAEQLKKYNEAYRNGKPLVTDAKYDELIEKLKKLDPFHEFLHSVEPEKFEVRKEIKHPVPMLSLEKAYTKESLEKFIARVKKAGDEIGVTNFSFRATPKLDGLAARDDGESFASRGNGAVGYEISNVFKKGAVPVGGRGLGLGELVCVKSYFDTHLADKFEHPRNMVVGIVSSDRLNEFAQKAIKDKTIHFVAYSQLTYWIGDSAEFVQNYEKIAEDLISRTDYPVDGIVLEVTEEYLKKHMGSTANHCRWQIAIKSKGETALTFVKKIIWQVGRTGNITPVLEVCPVSLSGATIRRVTAHHAGLIKKMQISEGSEIKIIRSGEVIPKLESIVKKTGIPDIPEKCPSCGNRLEWNNDFLKCSSFPCKAQIEQSISHWFRTLGNADWFGIKTIQKLVDNGFDSLEKIYAMDESDFVNTGFGPVQSKNLANAINTSKTKSVEDWRFLAAFGILNLGTGDSRKLLSYIKLKDLVHVKAEHIESIHGFGRITSCSIENSIKKIRPVMEYMLSLNFNLEITHLVSEVGEVESKIAGKGIVFSGKMERGNRSQMQERARKLGAKVQTSVSSGTDYLVCGEKTGAKKIEKAKKLGVKIVSEIEYLGMF